MTSASCRLCKVRNVENNDLGNINVEVECGRSRERFSDISVPITTRNRVNEFRIHGNCFATSDSNGHGPWGCRDGNRRGCLREGPSIGTGAMNFSLARAKSAGSHRRSRSWARDPSLIPFGAFSIALSSCIDSKSTFNNIQELRTATIFKTVTLFAQSTAFPTRNSEGSALAERCHRTLRDRFVEGD